MTEPKQRLPGVSYFVTGVCERHEHRLKPGAETNAAFAVALVEAASRYGIEIVAVCQMSSHYHAVVYDRLGAVSDFLRDFHAVVGRYGSARDGVEACAFWSRGGPDTMVLGDVGAVIEKVAYTLANPTKDLVVEQPEQWHGVRTRVEDLGTGRGPVFERPSRFFDAAGWVSDAVMVGADWPWELEEQCGAEAFREGVRAGVERLVRAAHARVAAGDGEFMGLARARRLSVWHASERVRAGARRPRRRVAAATKGRELAMLQALLAFRERYRRARVAWVAGADTEFPPGTWAVWRHHGAKRAQAGETEAALLIGPWPPS